MAPRHQWDDSRRMERRWLASVAIIGVLIGGAWVTPLPAEAAQPNQLRAPTVSPRAGTTATTFVFTVIYEGRDPAASVAATVGGQTVPLALVSGSASNGTYSGASTLAEGTWTVTFTADAERGNDPVLGGGSVQVVAATPVPAPIVTATPVPAPVTPAPTAPPAGPIPPVPAAPLAPAPAAPVATAAPGETPAAAPGGTSAPDASGEAAAGPALPSDGAAGAPRGAIFTTEPTVAPAGVALVSGPDFGETDWVWRLMLGGLGLIGLVGLWGILLGRRDRRRQRAEQAGLAAAMAGPVPAAVADHPRTPAVWELDAQLEEERIGTVDFLPVADDDTDEAPAVAAADPSPKRVNSRTARLEAARTRRAPSRRKQVLEADEGAGSA